MTSNQDITVRRARDEELERVVRLRWNWTVVDRQQTPEMDEATFVDGAAAWARDRSATHIPFAAVTAKGDVVGMAWLAKAERVASTKGFDRWSGDLQSCYVMPEYRNRGIGGRLVRAVLDAATEMGAEHVTVHTTAGSPAMYTRNGFRQNPRSLFADAAITEVAD
ncbi:MAG: GNAT family N-acetyltransferase [Propionibacterium sp.]|nr:GNAT family N-acetyltransferase [Propionibacterium sp.]